MIKGQKEAFPDWQPFTLACPADQKMIWNMLQKGGSAKIKEQFCPYCTHQSSCINKANDVAYSYCATLTADEKHLPFDTGWECLHRDIILDDFVAHL